MENLFMFMLKCFQRMRKVPLQELLKPCAQRGGQWWIKRDRVFRIREVFQGSE
jgi:hypothetical protein